MDGWIDLVPQAKAASAVIPVRFGMQKIRGAHARGVLLIRRDVLTPLKMETWRVHVRVGSSPERRHQIAIVPAKDGMFELGEVGKAKGGGVFRVRLPIVDRFPDIALALAPAPHKVEHTGAKPFLTIDLPAAIWRAGGR